jgi:hypothetical protein
MSAINPETRRRLEALKEKKAQYGVGSQDAFKFLKAMRAHEEFIDRLCQGASFPRPALKAISLFLETATPLIRDVLRLICIRRSNTENLSLTSHPEINTSFFTGQFVRAYEPPYGEACNETYWALNFLMLVRNYLNIAWMEEKTDALYDMVFLHSFLNKTNEALPFLVLERTGERVTLADFAREDRFHQGNEKDFWELEVECMLDCEVCDEDEDVLLNSIRKGFETRNLQACHRFSRAFQLGREQYRLSQALLRKLKDNAMPEEYEFLLAGGEIFGRAEREYTLHTYETERRIALCVAYRFLEHLSEGAEVLVKTATDQILESRKGVVDTLNHLAELNAPNVIMESQRKLYRQRCYEYLALRKNKRWLVEFFSR